MKKTVSFEKDITLNGLANEITSISLDNDLQLTGEDLVVGNFYVSGSYKVLEGDIDTKEYSYKIPCEIAISDLYDAFNSVIDIDDFTYELINNNILRIKIVVVIDNLERREDKKEEFVLENRNDEIDQLIREIDVNEKNAKKNTIYEKEDDLLDEKIKSFDDVTDKINKEDESYLTYYVYIVKENDTVESIIEKYSISRDELSDYNNLEHLNIGDKLIIPSFNANL